MGITFEFQNCKFFRFAFFIKINFEIPHSWELLLYKVKKLSSMKEFI